jgi:geranylgeranyl transferase type-1 subunit beta
MNEVDDMSPPEPVLLRDRHVKYWLRCAKTFLPAAYTSNDSNRMTLAFFIVSALDLLNLLESKIEASERDSWVNWIYSCQLDHGGGFRGFTGTKIGAGLRTAENQHWDPANVPATFFALVTLVILGDDLSRVKRRECLAWLAKVQRENGSFGETLGEEESIEGGSDLRFCCCAAGIRRLLHWSEELGVKDLDVDRLVAYIRACQVGTMGHSSFCFANTNTDV